MASYNDVHLLSFTVSFGQKFRSILAGHSGLEVPYRFQSHVRWATIIGRLDWGGRINFHRSSLKWLTPVTGCWQEALAPLHKDLSTRLLECPHSMVADFPQSKRLKREQCKSYNDLALWGHPCYLHFGHMDRPWFNVEGDYSEDDGQGPPWSVAITCAHQLWNHICLVVLKIFKHTQK